MDTSAPWRIGRVLAGAAIVAVSLTGCVFAPLGAGNDASSSDPADSDLPTASCVDAAATAAEGREELLATHPFYNAEEGELSDKELEEAREDSSNQMAELREPLYFACESPADFWAALQSHFSLGGVTSAEKLDVRILNSWCIARSDDPPLCSGWQDFVPPES